MLDVVSVAIHRLRSEQWWDDVHDAIDDLADADHAAYESEATALDGAAADGLRGD